MYFHVIENTKRDGQNVYRHIRTYKRYAMLERFLRKEGRPLWVVESQFDHLTARPYQHAEGAAAFGGFTASYWNTGGWGTTVMPPLPLL